MTQDKTKRFGWATLHDVLCINALVHRFGLTQAEAAVVTVVAGLAGGGDE
ncbi:hypothetical protein [Tabrizicola sp. BL-A-41-H6]